MNLLYLHTHDMGRYNGVYGFKINTPNMQSVADDGTVFRNAHCACPTCSPSRGALLTGQMPHVNGMMGLAHRGSVIHDHSHHLASFMASQGYHTTLVGVQHETKGPRESLGYQTVIAEAPGSNLKERSKGISALAADYIKNELAEPFFLAVGFSVTHRKYMEHAVDPDYVQVPACMPDNAETRADFADYITSCESLDADMGMVLDALKARGLYEDTLIVLTTDHGIAFPFMKCHLYDAGTGVTLIVKPAGEKPAVKCTDALTSQIDVFPTLCDMMGLEKPAWLEGVSLLPVITGEKAEVREHLFTEITFHASFEPVRAVRTQRYKYIRHFDPEFPTQVMPNIDDGYSKRFLMQHGLAQREIPAEELYDLYFDPNERNNLSAKADMQPILAQLRDTLDKWMRDTDDILLKGVDYAEALPGQLLNLKDNMHPDMSFLPVQP